VIRWVREIAIAIGSGPLGSCGSDCQTGHSPKTRSASGGNVRAMEMCRPCNVVGQFVLVGCRLLPDTAAANQKERIEPSVYRIHPGAGVQFRLQSRLVQVVPGDVIEFDEGRYELRQQIDIVADNITLRGKGPMRTVLSFQGQETPWP